MDIYCNLFTIPNHSSNAKTFLGTSMKYLFNAALITIVLAFFNSSAHASQCKGLSNSQCSSTKQCSWIKGYKRKDGVSVSAYCRAGKNLKKDKKSKIDSTIKSKKSTVKTEKPKKKDKVKDKSKKKVKSTKKSKKTEEKKKKK